MKPFGKKRAYKDYMSAAEWNRLTQIVSSIQKNTGIGTIVDSTGVHTRRDLPPQVKERKIARVVNNASGGGHYWCQIQKIQGDLWGGNNPGLITDDLDNYADEVTVLNIPETPIGTETSSHILETNTLMDIWQIHDDKGTLRWVGVAIGRYNEC